MPDNDLQISIGVDASGARQGADQAKSAIAGIGPQVEALGKTFGELGKSLKIGLDGFGQLGKAVAGVGKEGGGQLQSVAASLRNVSEAAAGLGKVAPAGLQAAARSASEMATNLSSGKLSGVSASLRAMGEAVAGVGRSAPAGLKAVSTAASDLTLALGSTAGQGASKLALLGEAAGGLAGVALAVGQVALTAAAATAEWAEHTEQSANASAEARQNAANLNAAVGATGEAFSAVGDTLANAFAPVLTTIVNALASLAKGFEDSYSQGGVAKAIVDTLIFAFRLLASVVEIALGAVIVVLEQVRSQIQQWRDQFGAAQTAIGGGVESLEIEFQTLGRIFGDVLTGDFGKAVSDFKSGLADMQRQAQQTVANIQQEFAKLRADQLAGAQAETSVLSATGQTLESTWGGQAGVNAPSPRHPAGASPSASSQSPSGSAGSECQCDPAAAACEQAAQAGAQAATQGDAQRLASASATNIAIAANFGDLSAAFARFQSLQLTAAKNTDAARQDSSSAANTRIREDNDRTLNAFESSMKGVVNTFASGLARMVEGGESFGKVMGQVGEKILDDVFRVVIGMVEKWAWGETEKVLATTQGQALLQAIGLKTLALEIANDVKKVAANASGNAAIVASNTAVAAAGQGAQLALTFVTLRQDAAKVFGGLFAAFSQNPATAPAAPMIAAAGAASVMGFSAAGGYDIPAGVNPLTQLHAQEMVLPARLANPMRDMLATFGSAAGAPSSGGHMFSFGDTHIHGAPNMSPADFRQALAEHRASVAEAVASALHGGWRPSYRQPVGAL